MSVTDLAPPLQELAAQRPRLTPCGCLADERCRRCSAARFQARKLRSQGQSPRRVAQRIGAPLNAVELEEALDHRAATDEKLDSEHVARLERLINSCGLNAWAAGKVRNGKSVPNAPLRAEWLRRKTAVETAALSRGEQPDYLVHMTRMVLGTRDTSHLQRALGVMQDVACTRRLKDGTTRKTKGRYRAVMPRDMAEAFCRVWGTDLDALFDHYLAEHGQST